jgi:hypothetical protein
MDASDHTSDETWVSFVNAATKEVKAKDALTFTN